MNDTYKVHVTYASEVEVNVYTDDEPTATSFYTAFSTNPEVAEVTLSRMGVNNYRHMTTHTRSTTTLPI
jgi:hypothetical protein